MKLISVKIHTDIAMVVPDDYDTNDPNLIEAISEAVKQDLVNIFDDTMVTIKEIETIEDIPLGYLPGNTEPWLAPDLNDVEIARYGQLTCKELLTLPIHNGKLGDCVVQPHKALVAIEDIKTIVRNFKE